MEGLTALTLEVHAPAMVPWDCGWLTDAPELRDLAALGLYAWPDRARAALRSARQLRTLTANPNEGGDSSPRRTDSKATTPATGSA